MDIKSDKMKSANTIQCLIKRDKVVAIIGTYAPSRVMAGGKAAKMPVVGASCTNPLVTLGKAWHRGRRRHG